MTSKNAQNRPPNFTPKRLNMASIETRKGKVSECVFNIYNSPGLSLCG